MIAFLDDHPLVRLPDGTVIPFERRWLEGCLESAALLAGYDRWWLSGHVTESVSAFLKQDFEEPILGVDGLERAVKTVLESIGYGDVAECYETLPPPVRISLPEVAKMAGDGFELLFFELLRKRIGEALDTGAAFVECDGLQSCVKMLCRAKHWRGDCRGLSSEIVEFAREQTRKVLHERPHFCLQVL